MVAVGSRLMRSRFAGCLLGVGVGDALGAAVEFATRSEILRAHGPDGITAFEPWSNELGARLPAGSVTDDTQMTVATGAGLLDWLGEWRRRGAVGPMPQIWQRYLDWLATQDDPAHRRYPGATCLDALRKGVPGDTYEPINDRKGSGGVMRVAPVGLAFPSEQAFEYGCESAALTHGHPSGFLAAGFLSQVISRLVRGASTEGRDWAGARGGPLPGAIAEARETLVGWDDHEEVLEHVDTAVELYMADATLDDGFECLGEGWIAEEALGIALFCALNFPNDFSEGVLAAVNITGDSDTTGSMTGALLGAALGDSAIPHEWVGRLEARDTLSCLAGELYTGFIEDGPASAEKCLG